MRNTDESKRQATAAEILDLFKDTFAELRTELFDQWVSSKDATTRETLHARFGLIDDLESKIYASAKRVAKQRK